MTPVGETSLPGSSCRGPSCRANSPTPARSPGSRRAGRTIKTCASCSTSWSRAARSRSPADVDAIPSGTLPLGSTPMTRWCPKTRRSVPATSSGCTRSASLGPKRWPARGRPTTSVRPEKRRGSKESRGSGGSIRRTWAALRGPYGAAVAPGPPGLRSQAAVGVVRVRLPAGDVQTCRETALGLLGDADPVRRSAGRQARRDSRSQGWRLPGRRDPPGRRVRQGHRPTPSTTRSTTWPTGSTSNESTPPRIGEKWLAPWWRSQPLLTNPRHRMGRCSVNLV